MMIHLLHYCLQLKRPLTSVSIRLFGLVIFGGGVTALVASRENAVGPDQLLLSLRVQVVCIRVVILSGMLFNSKIESE